MPGQNLAVSWDHPLLGPEACTLIGYEVRYKEESGPWERVELPIQQRYDTMVEPGSYTIRVSARYGTAEDIMVTAGTPEPIPTPTPTPSPLVCSISATFRADVVLGVSGEWERSAACVGPVRIEYKRIARHAWEHGIVDAASSFELDGLKPIKYRFRAHTLDANGRSHWSDTITFILRRNPDVPIQVGRPENVRVSSGFEGGLTVEWDAPESVPAGSRLTGYYVEYWPSSGGTNRSEWHKADFTPGEMAAWSCNTRLNCPGFERRLDIFGLPAGETHYAQVLSELTAADGSKTLAYSTASDPIVLHYEPFTAWWIDATPTLNSSIGRVFMSVNANYANASSICRANAGEINCPPRTLISLDVNPGGTYSLTIQASGKIDESARDIGIDLDTGVIRGVTLEICWYESGTQVCPDENTYTGPWPVGMRHPYFVWGSVRQGLAWFKWSKTGAHAGKIGSHVGYELRYRQWYTDVSEDSGLKTTSSTDWQSVFVQGENTLQYALELFDDTEHVVITNAGTPSETSETFKRTTTHLDYNVVAVNHWDHDDDANTDPRTIYGAYHRNGFSTPVGEVSLPDVPSPLSVEHNAPGQLILTWKEPLNDGGADIFAYHLRYRLAGSSDGYKEVVINPQQLVPIVPSPLEKLQEWIVDGYYKLTGLTSGARYDIAVRAINVAGGSSWAEFRSESGMGIAPD